MQHHERLTKVYRGLDADQLAALAFHYQVDSNDLEFKRIASAVPMKSYTCPDVTYQAKLDGLTWLAVYWAVEYWRLRCVKAELLGAAIVALRRANKLTAEKAPDAIEADEKADDLLCAHEQAERHLLALDAALVAICKGKGIDPADVRKLADAMPFKPSRSDIEPDTEVQAAMESAFAKLLDQ